MAGKLFIVSACSGAGKTTLVTTVINRLVGRYEISRLITYTSKTPRNTEIEGRDYYFLTAQEFESRIKEGFFLEWSSYYGNYYGSPSELIQDLKLGRSYILIADLAGARALANLIKDSILIWVSINDLAIIKKRLLLRNTENFEEIQKRLVRAQEEIETQSQLDIFKHNVVNENFEKAVYELELIIVQELKEDSKNK
jgi:guanylate kinase